MSLSPSMAARVGRGIRSARVGLDELRAPAEFSEAVELYAREHDRHAVLKFVPQLNVWQVEFTLKANDPRLLAWKEGRTREEPKEIVQLWDYVTKVPQGRERPRVVALRKRAIRQNMKTDCYIGYTLADLGVSGMRQFLEEGNTWGRGKHKSHAEATKEQQELRAASEVKIKADARQHAIDRGMDRRRGTLDIPYLRVGIDLQSTPEPASGEKK